MSSTGFDRRSGVLHAEGVPLPTIAAAVGTPAYVYCAGTIRARYQRLARAFEGIPHRIHFAMKANSTLAVLRLLQELGAGVDIVSGGELFRAREAGFEGRDVVFSGVGKTVQEIEQALDDRVLLINVESEAELVTIDAVAARKGVMAPIAIRVNPEVTVETPHAYIKTGEKGQKFGIPRDDISRLVGLIRELPHVTLRGLGMHLGSQIGNADPLRDALPRLLAAVETARSEGHDVRYLDVGGGLSVPYEAGEHDADVEDYAALVRAAGLETGLTLLLEPGRYIVAESGALLTRVLYRKHAAGKDFVVTDAGMNDLIRPALYQAYHAIEAVVDTPRTITADVVGPICESGDFFAKHRDLPDVAADDLLVIRTAGAYGYTMTSNYNSRPRPVEVLADGDRFAIITERERYEDLVRLERAHLQWRTI
ncbi:diaminopimelate decarboxylase [Gemmatimonas aurantiaca]|uniref:diaminopimelate decarboxylase n=1 Tax=Gemmatimonas aurantiaca TaxID=173480 RepID=UPI00301D4850